METQALDILLIRANNDYLGGYVKWFTDLPASTGYPVTLVFLRGGGMTWISQGHFGLDRNLDGNDPVYRGVSRIMGAPGYASVSYSADYEIDAVERALEPHIRHGVRKTSVGVVGPSNIPWRLADRLRARSAGGMELIDASDLVDQVKMVKSAEEIVRIEQTARLQDASLAAVEAEVRPGMKDYEITAIAQSTALALGSEQGVYLVASAPIGTAAPYNIRHFQARTIRRGDYFNLLVENSGPGGFYTELGRMFVLGEATEEMQREMELVVRAQDHVAALLRPGTPASRIWGAYNQFMIENGRPEEKRLFCHGQGYDLVERPLVRHDEPAIVSANMNFACHPTFVTKSVFCTACDNFLVREDATVPLHRFRRGIIEIT